MEPIYIAALLSFIVGLFGYIIIHFWILPINRYLKIKDRLSSNMNALLTMLRAEQPQNNEAAKIQARRVSLRRQYSDLVSTYQDDLHDK